MSYRELYMSPSLCFAHQDTLYEKASVVILGVPFDRTSTFRPGSRFAPKAVREVSLYMAGYSLRAAMSIDDVGICDLGDLDVVADARETLKRLELVVREILENGKRVIVLGGEHTVTLGIVRAIEDGKAVVSFDAHPDLADEYMGEKLSHMTFMRRLVEEGVDQVVIVGVRGVAKEELDFADRSRTVSLLTSYDLRRMGSEEVARWIQEKTRRYACVHLSIDLDVLDPAYAPAVCSPEPEGISTAELLSILHKICEKSILTVDVTEVTPQYDTGMTALQAAKIISEIACYLKRKS